MNILRPTYMRQLIDAQNNGLIKVVSGIRRAGKSYLLKTLLIVVGERIKLHRNEKGITIASVYDFLLDKTTIDQ